MEEHNYTIKNKYKVTKSLMMSWANELHLRSKGDVVLFVLWCIVGSCGLLSLIINLATHADLRSIYFSVAFLFLALYKLYIARLIEYAREYNRKTKELQAKEWLRITEFSGDGIVFTEESRSVTLTREYNYRDVTRITVKKKYIIIYFDNIVGRLYKTAFDTVTWQQFVRIFIVTVDASKEQPSEDEQ